MTTFLKPIRKSPPAERTSITGRVYPSKAQMARADQLFAMYPTGTIDEEVTFCLGCPENKYRVDFTVRDGWLTREDTTERVRCPVGWAEDVKGYETREFRRWKRLWRIYGDRPLVILKPKSDGRSWRREYVIPGEPAPKRTRKVRKPAASRGASQNDPSDELEG